MNSENLGIEDLTIGVSQAGMEQYREDLKMEMFDNTIKVIDDNFPEVVNVLNTAWQGVSRDRFIASMEKEIGSIKADLEYEKADLDHRLQELESNYFKEDERLMPEA